MKTFLRTINISRADQNIKSTQQNEKQMFGKKYIYKHLKINTIIEHMRTKDEFKFKYA